MINVLHKGLLLQNWVFRLGYSNKFKEGKILPRYHSQVVFEEQMEVGLRHGQKLVHFEAVLAVRVIRKIE